MDSDPADESAWERKGLILFLNVQFAPVNRLDWMRNLVVNPKRCDMNVRVKRLINGNFPGSQKVKEM